MNRNRILLASAGLLAASTLVLAGCASGNDSGGDDGGGDASAIISVNG